MSLGERKSRGNPPQCGGLPLLLIRMGEQQPLAVREGARRGARKEQRGSGKPTDGGWQHTASRSCSRKTYSLRWFCASGPLLGGQSSPGLDQPETSVRRWSPELAFDVVCPGPQS